MGRTEGRLRVEDVKNGEGTTTVERTGPLNRVGQGGAAAVDADASVVLPAQRAPYPPVPVAAAVAVAAAGERRAGAAALAVSCAEAVRVHQRLARFQRGVHSVRIARARMALGWV